MKVFLHPLHPSHRLAGPFQTFADRTQYEESFVFFFGECESSKNYFPKIACSRTFLFFVVQKGVRGLSLLLSPLERGKEAAVPAAASKQSNDIGNLRPD